MGTATWRLYKIEKGATECSVMFLAVPRRLQSRGVAGYHSPAYSDRCRLVMLSGIPGTFRL